MCQPSFLDLTCHQVTVTCPEQLETATLFQHAKNVCVLVHELRDKSKLSGKNIPHAVLAENGGRHLKRLVIPESSAAHWLKRLGKVCVSSIASQRRRGSSGGKATLRGSTADRVRYVVWVASGKRTPPASSVAHRLSRSRTASWTVTAHRNCTVPPWGRTCLSPGRANKWRETAGWHPGLGQEPST
jgi:hypothetical protein